MANFTLPRQDDDAHPLEEEDPNYVDPIEKKVKEWALKKMAEQFANWKKRLHKDFVLQKKTPEFTGAYEKLRDQWEEFAKYKKSDEAKKRSATNKKNASKKDSTPRATWRPRRHTRTHSSPSTACTATPTPRTISSSLAATP